MTAATTIDDIARPSVLDAAVARMVGDEPTLTDISAVLHIIGTADDIDGVRIQALAFLAARALGKFSTAVRYAPPDALNDVVADVMHVCWGPLCDNEVAPWEGEDFCSPSCRNAYLVANGEA